jgi:hypothetical protein
METLMPVQDNAVRPPPYQWWIWHDEYRDASPSQWWSAEAAAHFELDQGGDAT